MHRRSLAKLAIVAGSVAAALVLTVYRPTPSGMLPFGVGQAVVRAAPGSPAASAKDSYDLTSLKVFNATLVKIRDYYVDPTRVDPKEMLYAALDQVQRSVPEVLVEPRRDRDEVVVTVKDQSRTFPVGDVDSPWRLSSRLKEIFRFVQGHLRAESDAAQIEYAAVNGVLGTLDPHSVLLDPESAREMDISTSGKFGGIGITIGMRKGRLTVLNLISDATPAALAGVQAGDHIVRINDEPTENLTLNEAMNRLRGDPLTKVRVSVARIGADGVAVPKDFAITRDVIQVSSIKSKMLSGKVGYLRLVHFAQRTGPDLREALQKLKQQGARAWVLDLRGNPGGLLDQAIKVSDLFVELGTIVTTVGYAGKKRDENRAQVKDTEATAPVAVLVNGGSASASEIVAGALKNLDRAVIIGRTTFGKGSVQVLYDLHDGSKLKLTIAQYLTPNDISIQSVGITPDIELAAARVPEKLDGPRDTVRLLARKSTTEADLDAHLTSRNTRAVERPVERIPFLDDVRKPAATTAGAGAGDDGDAGDDEPEAPPDDDFVEDFEIRFARDFVSKGTSSPRRKEMLTQARAFVEQRRAEEDARIVTALGKLGVDWSVAPAVPGHAPQLSATFSTDRAGLAVPAGEIVTLTGSVTNSGDAPAYRVHARAESDDWVFEETELVFGKVLPGEIRTFSTKVRVPKDAASRVDLLNWEFTEAHGHKVTGAPLKVTVTGLPRPQFAYTYQLIDDPGNGDGLLQVGESFRLLATVKNVGVGASLGATASIGNKTGDGLVVKKGRYELEAGLAPGEEKTLEFTFDVKPSVLEQERPPKVVTLDLFVYDATLREGLSEKLVFPIAADSAGPTLANGTVRITRTVELREGAADDAPVIGTARGGTTFRMTGKAGNHHVRIELATGRPGFLPTSAITRVGTTAANPIWEQRWRVTPPTVTLATHGLETTEGRVRLSGTVQDDNHVEDVYVIVANRHAKIDARKVFYRSNRGGKTPDRLDFIADIPLWPGNNMVTIVARENDEVRSAHTIFLHRAETTTRAAR